MTGWMILLFFLLHAAVLFVLYRLIVRPKVDATEKGVWLSIFLVSAVIPIVGELFGLIGYVIARRFASPKTLLDYDEYINFDTLNLERLQQQAKEDLDLVPLTEALQMDGNKRKQSITQLMSTPLMNTEEYLHLGLEHEDTETVHYAATVRNTLFDRYDLMLKQRIAQVNPERPETIYPVIETGISFLDSGLLDHDMQMRIQQRILFHLDQLSEYDETDETYLRTKARLSFRSGDLETGERLAEALTLYHPKVPDGYVMLIEHHMTNGDWASLRPTLDRLHQHLDLQDIPEDYRFVIQQLEGAHI
ncbi:hypothetical protein [Exiguobacterium sp. AT1b]|uniref:Uncharacterized protein n=1 Tax=Exiguobacterium sp. (strain ATCC BAA-1283 / AT1b) TaxID=360911 RepID=C4L747_EXISA|nr:hypothetical protein [Exiguobacterium sp. AT1b]ACQ70140.1 hypothetical protein EAT1b_1213 [Exiguobacterium sp. AT1b]